MRRTYVILLTTLTLIVLTSMSIHAQKTRKFKMTNVAGTGGIPLAIEIDGKPAEMGICAGNSDLGSHNRFGSSFKSGKFTCTTTGWMTLGDWMPSVENCPGGFESIIETNIQNHIIRFEDGDMMYWIPDELKASYLCFYPDDSKYSITGSWMIMGGSGRFKGVTGEAIWTALFDGVPLGPDLRMFAAHDGVVNGTIIFPE